MAFCVTVYVIFAYNFEFDSYYTDTDNIYRIHSIKKGEYNPRERHEVAPIAMLDQLQEDHPDIRMTR